MPRHNGSAGNRTATPQARNCPVCHQTITCRDRRRARAVGVRTDRHVNCALVRVA